MYESILKSLKHYMNIKDDHTMMGGGLPQIRSLLSYPDLKYFKIIYIRSFIHLGIIMCLPQDLAIELATWNRDFYFL